MSDAETGSELSKEVAAVGRVSELVLELAESSRSDAATIAFGLMLTIDHKVARDAGHRLLTNVQPIKDPRVAAQTLRATRRRVVKSWPGWIGAIEHGPVDDVGVQAEIQALAAHAWGKSTQVDSDLSEDDLEAALGALAGVADRTIGDWNELDEKVRDDVTAASLDASTVARQMTLVEHAVRFANEGLIKFAPTAAALAERTNEALQLQSGPLDTSDPMSKCVSRWVELICDDVSGEERTRLRDSASSSPWLQSPLKETLVLKVAREQRNAGEVTESPLTPSDIVALASTHGAGATEAMAIWLEGFATDPGDVAAIVETFPSHAIPPIVEDALAKYAIHHPGGASSVAVTLVKNLHVRIPSNSLLRSLRGVSHSDADIADALVDAYEAANNNEEREHVLKVWEAAEPSDDAVRKTLIRRVLLPCAAGSKRGLDIVLSQLRVAIPPPYGTKGELRDALRRASRDRDQRRKVENKLVEVDLVSRGVLGFGRRNRSHRGLHG